MKVTLNNREPITVPFINRGERKRVKLMPGENTITSDEWAGLKEVSAVKQWIDKRVIIVQAAK